VLSTTIHRRQFVLGPGPWREYPDWAVLQLPGCGVLSFCPTLPVQLVVDAGGKAWALLGVALQSDPARADPGAEIAATPTPMVPRLGTSWSGRWALIGNGRVYPDAAGLLGCYFWNQPTGGRSAACWVSSSPALLGRAAAEHGSSWRLHPLAHERGLDWFPPPWSSSSAVGRLLPSQLLDLPQGRPEPRSWLPDVAPRGSYEEVVSEVGQQLVTSLRRLASRIGSEAVWVPLTGGFDSRLVLAAALRAGLPVRTYTNYRARMSLADFELPERVARVASVPHEWHRPGRAMARAEREYDQHSAGETAGVDRAYFARGQWDFAGPRDCVLRGGGFEVGRCYYYRRFANASGSVPPPASTIAEGLREPPGTPAQAALAEWISTVDQSRVPGLDWRDRLYLEQRLAGWLSAVEQSLDLAFAERVHVANSAATYALLLGLPEDIRASSQHQRDLIALLFPPLAELPFNAPEEAFGRWSRIRYRIRQDPRALIRSALARFGVV
jgi:hypothetical protein